MTRTCQIDDRTLSAIQDHFHALILKRAAEFTKNADFELPELRSLLESSEESAWFAVPGMYGGFGYRFVSDEPDAKLVAESWCRICDGSAQRHEITANGIRLMESGWDSTMFAVATDPKTGELKKIRFNE